VLEEKEGGSLLRINGVKVKLNDVGNPLFLK